MYIFVCFLVGQIVEFVATSLMYVGFFLCISVGMGLVLSLTVCESVYLENLTLKSARCEFCFSVLHLQLFLRIKHVSWGLSSLTPEELVVNLIS